MTPSGAIGAGRCRISGAASRRTGACCAALVAAFAASARAASPVQGDQIVNVASITSTGTATGTASSNPAVITVRIATPATIELLQYGPGVAGAQQEAVVQGAFRTGAAATAPFAALPAPKPAGGAALAVPGNLPLIKAAQIHQGDPLFIRVVDPDQNLDRTARDTLLVAVADDLTGDVEVVRLTEDGPDTGVFVGYVPTTRAATAAPYDGVLQVLEKSVITARYVDPVDAGDVTAAAALVDPTGKVFDSRTGQPVDGAQVTLIDTATGAPAQVFSDDGVTSFPSTVTSGGSATDGAGRVVSFAAGGFRFPLVRPGTYRYEVKPPPGYASPSKASAAALQALPGAPFALIDPGSRGEAFTVVAGAPLRIDIPVDPSGASLVGCQSRRVEMLADPIPTLGWEVIAWGETGPGPRSRLRAPRSAVFFTHHN